MAIPKKVDRFKVEMPALPRRDGRLERAPYFGKISDGAATAIELSSDRSLDTILMTVTRGVVAFSVEVQVFSLGELCDMQTMGGKERQSHSEKNTVVRPRFGKEIIELEKPNPARRASATASIQNEHRYRLSGHGQSVQGRHITIQIAEVEF